MSPCRLPPQELHVKAALAAGLPPQRVALHLSGQVLGLPLTGLAAAKVPLWKLGVHEVRAGQGERRDTEGQ